MYDGRPANADTPDAATRPVPAPPRTAIEPVPGQVRAAAALVPGPAGDGDQVHPYAKLPARIRPEDMLTEQAVRDPGDPTLGGRDPERDWMLRYAG